MTKAQQVRARRLEKVNAILEKEVEKIFDWILDRIDEDTNNLGECEFIIYYNTNKLWEGDYKCYELSDILCGYELETVFTALTKLINKEEGFNATLNLNDEVYDTKAITLVVSIS